MVIFKNKADLKWSAPLIATISHITIMAIAEFFRNAPSWKDSMSSCINVQNNVTYYSSKLCIYFDN